MWGCCEDQWDLVLSKDDFLPVDLMTTATDGGGGTFVCACADGSVGIYSAKVQESATSSFPKCSEFYQIGTLGNCAT